MRSGFNARRIIQLTIVSIFAVLLASCLNGRFNLRIVKKQGNESKQELPPDQPIGPSAKFKLSFFNIPSSVRKNDCYEVAVGATDERGVLLKDISTSITISSSTGVVIYSSLRACQFYDSTFEQKVFNISSSSAIAAFYFRSDTEGAVSFSATAPDSTGLSGIQQPVQVSYNPFDGASGPNGYVFAAQVDSLGRIYIGGAFTTVDDITMPYIARYSSDGRLDKSFVSTGSGFNNQVNAIVIQSDGKVLVGGSFDSYNGTSRPYLARLNDDGSLDATYSQAGTGLNMFVKSMVLQTDDRLVVGGWFDSYNGTSRPYVARIDTNGGLDTTFAPVGSGINNFVDSMALQTDGKILVGGWFSSYNGTSRAQVARLNPTGSLDTSFTQSGSGLNSNVNTIAIQSDGKVLVGGDFSSYNGTSRQRAARLNTNGSLDTSFALAGSGLNGNVRSLGLSSDGKITLGGFFTTYNATAAPYVVRLLPTGGLDTSLGTSEFVLDSAVERVLIFNDDSILIGGRFSSSIALRSKIARINADGSLNSSFAVFGFGLNGNGTSVTNQIDGKVIVGGEFSAFDGNSAKKIARFNADGTFDNSFQIGSGFNGNVGSVSLQSDGKILVGGSFTSYDGTSRPYISRLNVTGGLDSGFVSTGAGLNAGVEDIAVQTDQAILIGGSFLNYNGTSRVYVARLQSNGSLDTTFSQTGSGFDSSVTSLGIQADGKVLIGGYFTSYNGTTRKYIGRLNTNGSLDSGFTQTGSGFDSYVKVVQIQEDQKILAGGAFNSYNGTSIRGIARLNSDGTLDTSFLPVGSGLNGEVSSIARQSDGKILVGGGFTAYDGTSRNRIARLNSDGSLDKNFLIGGGGFDSHVMDFMVLDNGKILAVGLFSAFGQSTVNFLARLTYIGTLD